MKIGDVVTLKSGSPRMVVHVISSDDGSVECLWYSRGEVKKCVFPIETVVIVPETGDRFLGTCKNCGYRAVYADDVK